MEIVAVATVAFLLAGFVKGALGFGFPIVALVVLTLALGLLDALALIVIPTLVSNVWQGLSGPYLGRILSRMWLYFLLAMIAVLVSSQYLAVVNVNVLTMLLGAVLFFFSLSRLFDMQITVPVNREPLLTVLLGTVNGVLTGLTGSFMVPSMLYMQALGFPRDMLIQAMGIFFALSAFALTISLGRNNLISMNDAAMSTLALLPSFAGIFAGRWARAQIDEARFQRIFLFAALALGAYITIRSVLALSA